MTVRKNRDGEDGVTFGFKLETVELGENAKGRMVTTCVTAEVEAPVRKERKKGEPLGPNERQVLQHLSAALADLARDPPIARDIPPDVRCVTYEQWLDTSERYFADDKKSGDGKEPGFRKREKIKRAANSLIAKHLARHVDGWVWLPAGSIA